MTEKKIKKKPIGLGFIMHWDWDKTIDEIFRLSIMLLSFSFVFQNRTLLNELFLTQLPVGSILLLISVILILRHFYRTFRWYFIWLISRRNHGNILNVIVHFCLYLIVISISLSIPMSPDDLYASNNTTITPNNIMEHLNQAVYDIESINVNETGQSYDNKVIVVTDTPPVIEMMSEAESQNSVRQSDFVEHNTEYSSAVKPDSNIPLAVSQYMTDPKTVNYEYVLRGTHSQISYTLYGGMNDYLKSQPRYITYRGDQAPPKDIDFIKRNLDNEEQKYLLDPLVKKIQDITPNKDDQARIAISLVQNINYDIDGLRSGEIKEKYPYEVLYTGYGVCSEKSELLAYLLRGLGYEVAMFRFKEEKHETVGIKSPQEYSYRDTGYCFVESASPSIVTDSSGDYVVGNSTTKLTTMPDVLTICDGNSFDSVSEEYNDAVTWNTIGTGKVLDENTYNIWLSLVNKYGIKTTS